MEKYIRENKKVNLPAVENMKNDPCQLANEIIIGSIVKIDVEGNPWVEFSHSNETLCYSAVSTLGIATSQIGRSVALLFVNGDIKKPLIMGLIHDPVLDMIDKFDMANKESKVEINDPVNTGLQHETSIDGKRIILSGKETVILKCGAASITLCQSGKIMIRGKYLLNRASGVNRIMGGSVQVN